MLHAVVNAYISINGGSEEHGRVSEGENHETASRFSDTPHCDTMLTDLDLGVFVSEHVHLAEFGRSYSDVITNLQRRHRHFVPALQLHLPVGREAGVVIFFIGWVCFTCLFFACKMRPFLARCVPAIAISFGAHIFRAACHLAGHIGRFAAGSMVACLYAHFSSTESALNRNRVLSVYVVVSAASITEQILNKNGTSGYVVHAHPLANAC